MIGPPGCFRAGRVTTDDPQREDKWAVMTTIAAWEAFAEATLTGQESARRAGRELAAPAFPGDLGAYADQAMECGTYQARRAGQRGRAGQFAARSLRAARRFPHWAAVAGRTARYLWAVRAAIPWPVKVILAVAMVIKCAPLDFGADETLTVIAAAILNRTRPGLLKACFRAAQIRA